VDPSGHLSLQEAAARLGVHYQTVYRWVRQGSLPAVKIGGSYVVEVGAADAFAEARRRPAPPPVRREVRDWDTYATRLHSALLTGEELAARELLEDLSRSGIPLQEICDQVMCPALIRIGQEWMAGKLTIAEEHRASAICERILGRLGTSPPGRPRGVCVVCSAPGDDHHLPVEMATAVLREDHWRVHHLGSGVPASEVVALAADVDADLVVISVTWPPAAMEGQALAERIKATGRRVLVGAPGLTLSDLVRLAHSPTAG
jgi:excisionase family DNA binding protein